MEVHNVEDPPCVILEDDEDPCHLSPKSEPRSPALGRMDQEDKSNKESRVEEPPLSLVGESARFHCSDCDFRSDSSHQLEKHVRTHTGERPFCCTICGFAFSQKGNLTRHFRTHSDERPYRCPICHYSGRRKDALIAHLETHRQERLNICPYCGTAYKQKASLKYHMKRCSYQKMGTHPIEGHGSSSSDPFSLYEDEDSSHDSSQDRASGLTDTASNEDLEKAISNVMQMYGQEICLNSRAGPSLDGGVHVTPTITSVYSQAPLDSDRDIQNSQTLPQNQPPPMSQISPSSNKQSDHQSARFRGSIDLNKTRDFMSKNLLVTHNSAGGPQVVASLDCHEIESETSESNDSVSHHDDSVGSSSVHGHSRQKPHSSTRLSKTQDKADSTERKSPAFDSPQHRSSRRSLAEDESDRLCANCKRDVSGTDNFKCEHCEIIFLDHVMYTIHMGCHGFRDALECNICGHQCKDRYEFASHLARGKHL
ncbi:uncharacterized protein [Asterias amurensis]|uniref:uncharacterized protein isoform X2 n=1 Tax=Asterias amurensis TaxID=7602 RepID=UPI003AB679B6